METWCRSSFARIINDFQADIDLNDTLVVEVPKLEGNGHILHSILHECEAKSKDKNSTKVANNNSSSKIMANMASSYDTKRNSHVANYNETTNNMTPKLPKVTSSCMGKGGSGTSSLYECCKETIGDSTYDDDKCEDLTPHQQTFCDVFYIRLPGNSGR
ncbi:hypothetical protein Tco_1160583 [Tanacetum coccineum]